MEQLRYGLGSMQMDYHGIVIWSLRMQQILYGLKSFAVPPLATIIAGTLRLGDVYILDC